MAQGRSGISLIAIGALIATGFVIVRCSIDGSDAAQAGVSFQTRYVTADDLNCRASSSTASPVVTTYRHGDGLTTLRTENGWTEIDRLGGSCWASADYLASERPAPRPVARSTLLAAAEPPPPPPPARLTEPRPAAIGAHCGAKYYCSEMNSCGEAYFHLQQCGLSRLDGDGDGMPCESICR